MKYTKRIPIWKNPNKKNSYAGIHIVADFWLGKDITNLAQLKKILLRAATHARSTPLEFSLHKFSPQGITGIVMLAESHIALHSWPEIRYIALDIFTCGKNSRPWKALEFLQNILQPQKVVVREMKRGKLTKEIANSI